MNWRVFSNDEENSDYSKVSLGRFFLDMKTENTLVQSFLFPYHLVSMDTIYLLFWQKKNSLTISYVTVKYFNALHKIVMLCLISYHYYFLSEQVTSPLAENSIRESQCLIHSHDSLAFQVKNNLIKFWKWMPYTFVECYNLCNLLS